MEDPRAIIAREPMHVRQVLAIGIATAFNALDGFDVLSISFASPGIAHDWGIDRAALSLVLSMELFGMGIGALFLGTMADRIGRRPTILACLGVMAVGMGSPRQRPACRSSPHIGCSRASASAACWLPRTRSSPNARTPVGAIWQWL